MNALAARFPERQLTFALFRRGAVLWLVLRALMYAAEWALRGVQSPATVGVNGALVVVFLVCSLAALESRRVNEQRFFANLGISPLVAALLPGLPALCGELLVALVTRA